LLFDQIESIEHGLNIHIHTLAVVPNLVQDSTLSKRTLDDLRRAIPHVTPFELRKRVILQSAWDAGHSIFRYEPSKPDQVRAKREVEEDYLRLAECVRGAGAEKEEI
jgi:cellulose biosynthesis protein BcsQ